MKEEIIKFTASLLILSAFADKYGEKLGKTVSWMYVAEDFPRVTLKDPALAGSVLGKDGWTRESDRFSNCYSWTRTIDGVAVKIDNCEDKGDLNGAPVPPKIFPLMLEHA